MGELISTEIIEENGLEYSLKTFSDGSTIKQQINADIPASELEPTLEDKINYIYYKSTGVIV